MNRASRTNSRTSNTKRRASPTTRATPASTASTGALRLNAMVSQSGMSARPVSTTRASAKVKVSGSTSTTINSFENTSGNISTQSRRKFTAAASNLNDDDVCIVSAVRTPIGSFNGGLAGLAAPQLGAHVIKHAVQRSGIDLTKIDEVIMGNVISSNLGQAPARQAAVHAGLDKSVICTTVNKVCSSGLKAIMMGSNEIKLGQSNVIVAGGFESMTNTPYYVPAMRSGARIGDSTIVDGLMKDGLTDVYGNFPMGNCAEVTADTMKINRQQQDDFAIQSYTRAQNATKNGKFADEIVPVEITTRKGTTVVKDDEEPFKVNFDKLSTLRPAFKNPENPNAELSVTAGNASVLSDGAAALVLVSGKFAKDNNLNVRARVLSYADYEQDPVWFTTAPAKAIPKSLARIGLSVDDVDKFEINEAFSVVSVANRQLLGIDNENLNVYGGAVSLGHPLGASGARIVVTLLSALKQDTPSPKTQGRKIGVAGICNGGGGASAIVLESFE